MTTSLKRRSLSKPERGERIALYDLATVRSRNRNKAHSLLLEEFAKSELSKAELAAMLGKRPEQITRWLAGPSNLTLDTISDLVFALRGRFLVLSCKDELGKAKSNHSAPEWLTLPTGRPHWEAIKVGGIASRNQDEEKGGANFSIKLSTISSIEGELHGQYRATENQTVAEVG